MPLFRLNVNAAMGWVLLASGALAFAGLALSNLQQAAVLGLGPLMQWSGATGGLFAVLALCMAWLFRGLPLSFPLSSGRDLALRQLSRLVCLAYLLVHLYAFTRLAALWTVGCMSLAAFGLVLSKLPGGARRGAAS